MTPVNLGPQLDAIAAEAHAQRKGKLLERLIAVLFCSLPGIELDDEDVVNAFDSEEIDLIFWNAQHDQGLRFLDCPLVVECKCWSTPVPGREVRYFATQLKDKGRRNGIFIALNGITGNENNLTAAFFHVAAAMIEGVQILVVTGAELAALNHAEDLIPLLRRKLLEQTRQQIRASKLTAL
ncbi:restriction endonuclease [Cupriavidus sp. WS]|uniref:restriction endonuclease n=1 Tax=Cupriavidus sp. WS TaxID=1312922 RepID=UPI00037637FA|nr:restriction endonuclease [Cupriavidus sp. WS]